MEDFVRYLCHLYISVMPSIGLEEMLDSMNELFEFYTEKEAYEQQLLPLIEPIEVQWGETFVSPVLPLEFEAV